MTPLAALLLIAAGIAAYHNSFSGPFVYDDAPAILDNASLHHLWPLSGPLSPPHGEGLTVEGRPVLNLSLAINYALGGTRVQGYHVLNLAIHLLAGLVLFGIIRRTLTGRDPAAARFAAWAVALLWIVHPLQTEAVTYVIQRAESLMGLFYLLTLYCFIRGSGGSPLAVGKAANRPFYALSVFFCLLGMATKEVMVTAPVMIFFYDRTFLAGSFAAAWRQRRGYYLALAATWIPLILLVASTGGNRSGSSGFGAGVSWSGYVLTQFEALATYLRLTVWPHPLVFEYGTFWTTPLQSLPYAALILALAAATVWALFRRPALGFLGFWFFGILAPTSLTPGTTQMIVEHRMYLPLAALLVLFVLGIESLGRRGWRAVAVAAVVVLGCVTALRNRDYRSELAIWSVTAVQRPLNSRAHGNRADALISLGRTAEGVAEFNTALRLNPADAVASNNYGIALAAQGRDAEAIDRFEQAVRAKPRYARAHFNLANSLVHVGRFDDATGQYAQTLQFDPANAEAANNWGNALMHQGNLPAAIERFQQAIRLDPESTSARYDLANALVSENRLPEAIAMYEATLRLTPDFGAAEDNLGVALVRAKRAPEALGHFRAAVRLQPQSAEARFNLANALLLLGQPAEAIADYQAVLRLQPDHAGARRNLQRAERQMTASSVN